MTTSSMATVEEVRALLLTALPDADVSGVHEEANRITGEIRWQRFRGMSDRERAELVSREVRDPLGARGLNIGTLYLLAPGERLDG